MASSEFENIRNLFLGKIKDPELAAKAEAEANIYMNEWLVVTASDPFLRSLFAELEIDEDMEEISFQLSRPIDDGYDMRFVNNLFALGMVYEWLRPQYENRLLTAQMFTGKEAQFYSQSAHMKEMNELFHKAESELSKYRTKHGYSDFVLNGVR